MEYRVLKDFPGKNRIFKVDEIIMRPKDHPRTKLLLDAGYIELASQINDWEERAIESKIANLLIAPEDYVEGDKHYFTYDEALEIEKKLKNGFVEEVKDSLWTPGYNENYWCIDEDGHINDYFYDNDLYDKGAIEIGNCFKTRQEAQKAAEWLKAFKVLRGDTNGYRVKKDTGYVWFVRYDVYEDILNVDYLSTGASWCYINTPILFSTKEDAQASIDKHQKEWKIFLGVED